MADRFSKLRKLREDARALLDEGNSDLHGWRARLHRSYHFWAMVVRGFVENRCPVRASALAYATLLALIPMLAIALSVTSTFLKNEGEDQIERFIEQMVASITPDAMLRTNVITISTNQVTTTAPSGSGTNASQASAPVPEDFEFEEAPNYASPDTNAAPVIKIQTGVATNQVVTSALNEQAEVIGARKEVAGKIFLFIQNTRSGALGVTGIIVLILTAISMLSRIEITFNDIWGVELGRSWFMRVVLYWGVLTLVPLLLIVATGLATGPHLERTKELLAFSPFLANLLFRILPLVILCVSFSLFYMLMPNTRVSWQAALAGGGVAGILFYLNNMFSVLYVSRVVSNSKIYGSLGLVPVCMIGLYFAWVILLFGAQVAYAYQNREACLEQKRAENINQRGREFIALRLMTSIGQRFCRAEPPPSAAELALQLAVPSRVVLQILQTLCAARLVAESGGSEPGYLPARPLDDITCHDVLLALRATHGQDVATRDEPGREEVYGEFARIQEAERQAAASVDMQALVRRAENPLKALDQGNVKESRAGNPGV
jgi:membrane protein